MKKEDLREVQVSSSYSFYKGYFHCWSGIRKESNIHPPIKLAIIEDEGGTNDEWNLISLCRPHHSEIHSQGNWKFSEKYPEFKEFLRLNGWKFTNVFSTRKLRHD